MIKSPSYLRITTALVFMFVFSCVFSACTKHKQLGSTIRVAIRKKPKPIDPAHGGDYYTNILIARTYEGLLRYNYVKRPYQLEPLLAEEMPTVSKDKKVYTFKIKKGVMFQDDNCFEGGKGRELKASDFVYAFQRVLDANEASEGKWIFDGKVKEFKAIDDYTLQITLTEPNAVFLNVLTMPFASVVAAEAVKKYGQDFGSHPVGTGPFQLEQNALSQIIWKKSPSYRAKEAIKIDRIVDDIVIEDQPAWLNFVQGNHDYLLRIPKDNSTSVWTNTNTPSKEMKDKNIHVLAEPAVEFTYISFNWEDSVVGGKQNAYLRRAMSMAFDEAPLIEKFYLNLASRAEFVIPPGIFGYDSDYKNPNRIYNLTKAREILEKAGHPNGDGIPEITYEMLSDTTSRQIAEYFQRSMALLGIKIKLNASTWPELLSKISKKQAQMFGLNWLYDYPDAENGLQIFYSKNASPGQNRGNYSNPKYDEYYLKVAPMENSKQKEKLIENMRGIIEEDVPCIFELHRYETRLAHDWVKNFKIHAFEYNIEQYLEIDENMRDQALQ